MKQTEVIRRPLITEKTTVLREDGLTLVFQVAARPTRSTSSARSKRCSGRRWQSVRTALAHGKVKRQGRFVGRRSDWKKAYVRLRDGEKLPEFLQGA